MFGEEHSLALLWNEGYGGGLFVSFQDETSGKETYPAARYLLDTVKGADLGTQDGMLVLDFNFAYNPSCAYDSSWACPLATFDSRLSVEVRAGEQAPSQGPVTSRFDPRLQSALLDPQVARELGNRAQGRLRTAAQPDSQLGTGDDAVFAYSCTVRVASVEADEIAQGKPTVAQANRSSKAQGRPQTPSPRRSRMEGDDRLAGASPLYSSSYDGRNGGAELA